MRLGHESPIFALIRQALAALWVVAISIATANSYGQTPIESVVPSRLPLPASPATTADSVPARIQGGLPRELVLPPPSEAAKLRASRFVEAEINPELPLSLIVGRPKILRLSDTPKRIYVPNEDIIRSEAIDQQT